eukprot:scaffold9518_cov121-Skeletonema_dohrnii-CCMP3373.AAC.1
MTEVNIDSDAQDIDPTPVKTKSGRTVRDSSEVSVSKKEKKKKRRAAIAQAARKQLVGEEISSPESEDTTKDDESLSRILNNVDSDDGEERSTSDEQESSSSSEVDDDNASISKALNSPKSKKKKKKSPKNSPSTTTTSAFDMTRWLCTLGLKSYHPQFHIDEDISHPSDLVELEEKTLRDMFSKKPNAKIPVLFQQRVLNARLLVEVFLAIGRPITMANLSIAIIQNFRLQWKYMQEAAEKKEAGDFPVHKSDVDSLIYEESCKACLETTFGRLGIPLTYLIRVVEKPGVPPPLAPGKCHSAEYNSL